MKAEIAAVRLGLNDLDWATALLTEAFLSEPPVTALFDEPARGRQTAYFMKCCCLYALLFGEAYTTAGRDGVALWLSPGKTAMTPGTMYRAGMLSAPFRLSPGAFGRFLSFARHTDKLHRQAAPMPHYYLFVLGVRPSAQGRGIGGALLRSKLEKIDREKMPAFLETQSEKNVGLYRKFGFEVAAEGAFPEPDGLYNWAMLRKGQASLHDAGAK